MRYGEKKEKKKRDERERGGTNHREPVRGDEFACAFTEHATLRFQALLAVYSEKEEERGGEGARAER